MAKYPSTALANLTLSGAACIVAYQLYDYTQRKPKKSSSSSHSDPLTFPTELLSDDGTFNDELRLAIRLALRAGENMVSHCDERGTLAGLNSEESLEISIKANAADFATAVDLKNEKLILDGIRSEFPSHILIGEEETGTGSVQEISALPTWIVDPIDGTSNFASGLPLTCVSIGLCHDRIPVLGVVYAPLTNELYCAIRGRGAYRNGIRIVPSPQTKSLLNASVCFELGSAREEYDITAITEALKRVLRHGCRSARCLGSGVLDLCYVATGRLDVVYTGVANEGWKPWDYCAGMVVAEEAGCVMRSLYGTKGEYDENDLVVDGDYVFDIYSKSMICGADKGLVQECRRVALGL